jgi:hypothetical protein
MNAFPRVFRRRQAIVTAFATGIALALLCAQPANATHKTDHRYTVWGAIKYEDDSPAANIDVKLLGKDGAPMGEVKTDANGRYRILLHVHNEDVYKVFDMQVNNVTRKVRLLFNPNDLSTERGQRLDMVVKRQDNVETSRLQAP